MPTTPKTSDLALGLDPTGFTSIDGAELAELITTAVANTDRGMVINTTDNVDGSPNVPTPVGDLLKLQRYIWVRQSAASVSVYVWNVNGGNTIVGGYNILQWTSIITAAIGVGTIQTSNIALGAITDALVASGISASKLTGALPVGVAATTLNNNAVTTASITDANVTMAKLGPLTDATTKGTPLNTDYIILSSTADAGALRKALIGSLPGKILQVVDNYSFQCCTTGLSSASASGTQTDTVPLNTTIAASAATPNAFPAGTNGSAKIYPFDYTYTAAVVAGTSNILVKGVLNCALSNSPASDTTTPHTYVLSLWNGTTLIGSVATSVYHVSGGTEVIPIPFAFNLAGAPSTVYSFHISLNCVTAAAALGVGCYFSSATTLKPLFKTSANTIATDANYSITNVANNNQTCGLQSGYSIIESV